MPNLTRFASNINSLDIPTLAQQVVEHCTQFNHPAWSAFIEQVDPHIQRYVRKACKSYALQLSPELIEDLVQDVYCLLCKDEARALRNFRGESTNSFLAYLSKICATVVWLHVEKLITKKRKRIIAESTDDLSIPDKDSNQFLELLMKEVTLILDQLLHGRNGERNRLIFQAHFGEGLTLQEIAELPGMNIKISGVEAIIRRMREKIQQIFGNVDCLHLCH